MNVTTTAAAISGIANTTITAMETIDSQATAATKVVDQVKVLEMVEACRLGHMHVVHQLLQENAAYATQQDTTTGQSPLMAAASAGNIALCRHLLEQGAPWNAVDRTGQCAGNFATDNAHWQVSELLVEWGVRAELILGAVQRSQRQQKQQQANTMSGDDDTMQDANENSSITPVAHQPSTKPDYLRQRLQYTADGRALIDSDQDAVMMEWERPLMKAHAQMLMTPNTDQVIVNDPRLAQSSPSSSPAASASPSHSTTRQHHKRVLNVGFGMGIIDMYLQEYEPSLHLIIEAHPDVHRRMLADGWDKKPGVQICFGKWQDVLPQLISENNGNSLDLDAVFYDTYGEHATDLEDFHALLPQLLSKPHGRYSFFNGLAPDNLFFHGVACQCVKLQLQQLGLEVEFLACEMQAPNASEEWEGIRRRYWHGRETYYLPQCTWMVQPQAQQEEDPTRWHDKKDHARDHEDHQDDMDMDMAESTKRTRAS